MASVDLPLTRDQILAYRRFVGGLTERAPRSRRALRGAAWVGLQDSMPRAGVLSAHARVAQIEPGAWEDSTFVQVWGPRYSAYIVPAQDRAVFTLGRLPVDARGRSRAYDLAEKLDVLLDGGSMPFREAGRALGVDPNRLRYAATTGSVLLRWDGARQPTIRSVQAPDVDTDDARSELARRYLHVFGPSTADAFSGWAGIRARDAAAAFDLLAPSLTAVTTPLGARLLLSSDVDSARSTHDGGRGVRLLPSGDAYFLLKGADRSLLVPDPNRRDLLWTSRVWPGAILVHGEVVGTWRRTKTRVRAHAWVPLSRADRDAVESEAASLPLPDRGAVTLAWSDDPV